MAIISSIVVVLRFLLSSDNDDSELPCYCLLGIFKLHHSFVVLSAELRHKVSKMEGDSGLQGKS